MYHMDTKGDDLHITSLLVAKLLGRKIDISFFGERGKTAEFRQ